VPFGAARVPDVEYPPPVVGVSKPARVELAPFVVAVGGLRVAVAGIVDCIPVNVLGGNKDGFVVVKDDERFGSLSVFEIGAVGLDKVDVCRGPRILVLFRLTLCLGFRRIRRRSFSR